MQHVPFLPVLLGTSPLGFQLFQISRGNPSLPNIVHFSGIDFTGLSSASRLLGIGMDGYSMIIPSNITSHVASIQSVISEATSLISSHLDKRPSLMVGESFGARLAMGCGSAFGNGRVLVCNPFVDRDGLHPDEVDPYTEIRPSLLKSIVLECASHPSIGFSYLYTLLNVYVQSSQSKEVAINRLPWSEDGSWSQHPPHVPLHVIIGNEDSIVNVRRQWKMIKYFIPTATMDVVKGGHLLPASIVRDAIIDSIRVMLVP